MFLKADDAVRFFCNATNAENPSLVIVAASQDAADMHANRMNALVFALQDAQGLPRHPVCHTTVERVPDSEMPRDPFNE